MIGLALRLRSKQPSGTVINIMFSCGILRWLLGPPQIQARHCGNTSYPSKHKTFVYHVYNVGTLYTCYTNVLCLLGLLS